MEAEDTVIKQILAVHGYTVEEAEDILNNAGRAIYRAGIRKVVELVKDCLPRHDEWRGFGQHGDWRCTDDCLRCKIEAQLKEWGIEDP